mgnify:CR=1 FL=1
MGKSGPKKGEVGRPLQYDDPLLMEAKMDQYFDQCDVDGRPYTVPGLCYALGFVDRNALSEYAKRPRFSSTVKKARLKIEQQRAEKLVQPGQNTGGIIFDLVNNFDYVNPSHVKHSGDADGDPIKTESTVKADESVNQLLEELHRLKAGSAKPS